MLSMIGVVVFYTILCCYKTTPKAKLPRNARARAGRKTALSRRDNGNSSLRQRASQNNNQEQSQSSETEDEADKDK